MEREVEIDNQDSLRVKKTRVGTLLMRLAAVKNQERTGEQIVAMTEYLCKHFSFREIADASEYFLQRSPYFPTVDAYFEILRPIKTVEQRALELRSDFDNLVKSVSFSYKEFIAKATPELKQFVDKVGWEKAQKIYEKDALEIFKSIINNPEFHLGQIGAPKHEKLLE